MRTKAAMALANRTGTAIAPDLAAAMVEGTKKFPPSSKGDARAVSAVRVAYAKEAEPVGTMPPAADARGMVKTALNALTGKRPAAMLDKLGERLAFERSGVRLYDALLSKYDSYGSSAGGPDRKELEHIRDDELRHFHMLQAAIEQLGGDPTAVTPSANVQATASIGIQAVLVDPRTDFLQSLEQILVVELADNVCWEALSEMAGAAGEDALAERFGEALREEQEHLSNVRRWVALGQGRNGDSPSEAERSLAVPVPGRARTRSAGPRKATKRAAARASSKAGSRAQPKERRPRSKAKGTRRKRP